MKNNKGFTLVELLAVFVLISLIMVITIPNINQAQKKNKQKILTTKIDLAANALLVWAQNNIECTYNSNYNGCDILTLSNNNQSYTTLEVLAQTGLIDYDECIEDNCKIINPITNNEFIDEDSNEKMKDLKIYLEYNSSNDTVEIYKLPYKNQGYEIIIGNEID